MSLKTGFSEDELKNTFENIVDSDKLKNTSFLITGATGLIGSAIAMVLLEANRCQNLGNKIYLAARNKGKVDAMYCDWKDEYRFLEYDCQKEIMFSVDVDYIIHCAANAHPIAYAQNPVETSLVNVNGVANLLFYMKEKGGKRFLYFSSSEVYGNKDDSELYKEEDSYFVDISDSRSCYPLSKRLSENLCICMGQEYGVDSVIVRPGHIYGPNVTEEDSRAHAQFLRCAANDQDIVMKSLGSQLRSYCHVLDCVSAALSVLVCGKSFESYNISNKGSILTIKEFAELHAQVVGKRVVFELPDGVEASGYNRMTCSALDSEKLEMLGWNGLYDSATGVKQAVDGYKNKK